MEYLIVILLLLMIVAAITAVAARNVLTSIINLGAIGFLASITFLFLGAPDIAITQVAVESLALVILLRATVKRDLTADRSGWGWVGGVWSLAALLVIGFLSLQMFEGLPDFGESVMDRIDDAPSIAYLADGMSGTGAANSVTAILLDFRGYDTLGEATILFCSVLGALTVIRKRGRKEPDEPEPEGNEW